MMKKEITDLIQIYLENENFTVYKYYSSQDVLRDIDDLKIDLAILDVMMPIWMVSLYAIR